MTSEKYGVDTSEDEKTAEVRPGACPTCGSALRPIEVTGVRLCSVCGSAPFEIKDNGGNAQPKRKR